MHIHTRQRIILSCHWTRVILIILCASIRVSDSSAVQTASHSLCPPESTVEAVESGEAAQQNGVGGVVCCKEVAPGQGPAWERDYLLELAGAGPQGPCVCEGDPNKRVRVDIVSLLVVDYPHPVAVDKLREILSGFNSRAVVLLGDENCVIDQERAAAIVDGLGYTTVLRQYACGRNSLQQIGVNTQLRSMPLGYGSEMMRSSNDCDTLVAGSVSIALGQLQRVNATRVLRWAFMGTERPNRQEALALFHGWEPHIVGRGSKVGVAFAYSNADFVLSPRGNINLDCFRSYEASAFGAIPIVVGDPKELSLTFDGLGFGGIGKPPWLYAGTWEDALEIAQRMSQAQVRQRRNAILRWWVHSIRSLQRRLGTLE